jgi:flavin-dependent dehydrogenase
VSLLRVPRVVIIGGGPAGATIGSVLARNGLDVQVWEARRGPEIKVGECLPPSVNPLLGRLGLVELLRGDGHLSAYGSRSVWGSPVPVERDFIFGTNGNGWHLDRCKFEESLARVAIGAGVDWRYGHRLISCSRETHGWQLEVRTPRGSEFFDADFVVDASGRVARLARLLGIRTIAYDRLIGAAVFMQSRDGSGDRQARTLIEAVPSGWWYSANLPDGKLIAAYMTDSDLVDHASLRRTDGWQALMRKAEHTSQRVTDGRYRPVVAPRLLPAHNTRLSEVVGDRWVAAGDAAAAFDPLASYGISSAMGNGLYAALAIVCFLTGDSDALRTFAEMVDRTYAQYLLMHHDRYLMERRWPNEPFWQRRHSPAFELK